MSTLLRRLERLVSGITALICITALYFPAGIFLLYNLLHGWYCGGITCCSNQFTDRVVDPASRECARQTQRLSLWFAIQDMRASVLNAVLLALAWSGATDAAFPRLHFLDSFRTALPTSSLAHPELQTLSVPEPTHYKNAKPLIGVLSQACHYCPGK